MRRTSSVTISPLTPEMRNVPLASVWVLRVVPTTATRAPPIGSWVPAATTVPDTVCCAKALCAVKRSAARAKVRYDNSRRVRGSPARASASMRLLPMWSSDAEGEGRWRQATTPGAIGQAYLTARRTRKCLVTNRGSPSLLARREISEHVGDHRVVDPPAGRQGLRYEIVHDATARRRRRDPPRHNHMVGEPFAATRL